MERLIPDEIDTLLNLMITLMRGFLIIILILFFVTLDACAAELMQVKTSSIIQVGDHNRNYSVQLECLQVAQPFEEEARKWLKFKLPRGTRLNLRPSGVDNGKLLAKVTPIGEDEDISSLMYQLGLGENIC